MPKSRPIYSLRHIFTFLPAVALLISSAMAQTGTGTLRGTMTDDSGAIIPAANVTLTGKGGNKTAQTQADGTYVFQGLAPGQYSVKVTFPGFAPINKPVTIAAGSNVQVPVGSSRREAGDHSRRPGHHDPECGT